MRINKFAYRFSEAMTQEELFQVLTKPLIEGNFVDEDYLSYLLERESEYPTGLELSEINVSIPHTDSSKVKRSALSIAVLSNPVKFNKMDDPEISIDVNIVFLLTISEEDDHLWFISNIINLIQEQDKLNELVISDPDRIVKLIDEWMKEV